MERPQTTTNGTNTLPKAPKKILIVDDILDQLTLNKAILEIQDYEVFTASNGAEALQVLSAISPPDLILLDMQLGDDLGTDFLTELETVRPDIIANVPVVFLTGVDKVPKSKAIGTIHKPVDIDKFLSSVQHFIDQWPDRFSNQH